MSQVEYNRRDGINFTILQGRHVGLLQRHARSVWLKNFRLGSEIAPTYNALKEVKRG
jgi:hypothetical protein